jgi:drug/metabolite transporter (DMT)-like permease
MLGIIFGLIAAIGQGLGYALLKKSFDERSPSLAFFTDMIFGLLIWIPFGLILGVEWQLFSTVMWVALISALLSEAFVFFVLSKGDFALSQSVFATYPLFTLLVSKYVNGDVLSASVIAAIFLTVIGIIVLSLPVKVNSAEMRKRALLLWPLAGAIAVGVSDSLSKNIIDSVSTGTFLVALAIAQVPIALGYLYLEKQTLKTAMNMYVNVKENRYAFLGSFCIVSTMVFFWLAFAHTLASIASPITASYVVFSLFFAAILVKEKVNQKDLIGILLTILGVISLSMLIS